MLVLNLCSRLFVNGVIHTVVDNLILCTNHQLDIEQCVHLLTVYGLSETERKQMMDEWMLHSLGQPH